MRCKVFMPSSQRIIVRSGEGGRASRGVDGAATMLDWEEPTIGRSAVRDMVCEKQQTVGYM